MIAIIISVLWKLKKEKHPKWKQAKAIYSALTVARESDIITRILAEIQKWAEE